MRKSPLAAAIPSIGNVGRDKAGIGFKTHNHFGFAEHSAQPPILLIAPLLAEQIFLAHCGCQKRITPQLGMVKAPPSLLRCPPLKSTTAFLLPRS